MGLEGAVVEETAGEGLELLAEVGEEEVEAGFASGGEEVEGAELLLQMLSAGGGGVDEADVGTKHGLQGGDEQRVVGAGEEEGVHAALEEGRQVGLEGGDGGGVVEPVFLDEGSEEGSGLLEDEQVGPTQGEGVLVGMAADGAAGGNDTDPLAVRCGKGRVDAGFDDADDGDVVVFLKRGKGVGAGGVAGDDDGFDATGYEEADVLVGKLADRFGAFGSVREPGRVAEVDDGFVREELLDGLDDGEATDAGVKDAESLGIHVQGFRQNLENLEDFFFGSRGRLGIGPLISLIALILGIGEFVSGKGDFVGGNVGWSAVVG